MTDREVTNKDVIMTIGGKPVVAYSYDENGFTSELRPNQGKNKFFISDEKGNQIEVSKQILQQALDFIEQDEVQSSAQQPKSGVR